jgi:hypothetical protein
MKISANLKQIKLFTFGSKLKQIKGGNNMYYDELTSQAKNRAMEQISRLMKDHSSQYGSFYVDDMKIFMAENNITFDENGNILD